MRGIRIGRDGRRIQDYLCRHCGRRFSAPAFKVAYWLRHPEFLIPVARLVTEGAALRQAAVADFDPRWQGWRWHPTAAEYAARRWPLGEKERQERLGAALPAWAGWLERLREEGAAAAYAWLEAALPNLPPLLDVARHAPREAAWSFLETLDSVLPAPDRTLALRAVQEPLYRAMLQLASDEAGRARAQGMLGYALSALGRRDGVHRLAVHLQPCRGEAFPAALAASAVRVINPEPTSGAELEEVRAVCVGGGGDN